ncbi:MAG: hypothetical protein ACI9P5_004894 [Saprospiraceae bacterium]|jgi:hypothetical protein
MKHIYFIIITVFVISSSYAQPKPVEKGHYLFLEFTPGAVLMKSGVRNEASLNYNRGTEEMIFEKNGKKLAIAKGDVLNIDTVFIGDRKMVVVDTKLVELLDHSKWQLFIEHRCKVREKGREAGFGGTSETSAIKSHGSISAIAGLYELDLPSNFKIEPYTQYWLGRNGDVKKFVNLKALRKQYKSKNSMFKAYVKEHDVKYDNLDDVVQLIKYLEAI